MTDLIDRSSPSEDADTVVAEGESPSPAVEKGDDGNGGAATAASEAAPARAGFDLAPPDRWALAGLLAGAAVIHLVMAPSHLGESTVEGIGFLVAGWLQAALAVGVLLRPKAWYLPLSVVSNLVLVGVWAVSRTAGLPFGEHANHAESVSIVDGSAVGLELLAVALAAGLMWRSSGIVRGGNRVLAYGLPVAALLMASVAIGSPSARDHAAGSHGDHMAGGAGHAHGGEAAADDKGLSLITNGHQHGDGVEELDAATQAELSVQLAGTMELVQRYPTLADAEEAGYRRAGPFVPGLGAHYRQPDMTTSDADGNGQIDGDDVLKPFLIYDGVEADAPIAGFMYYVGGEEIPEGFAGPNDHWHQHTNVCIVNRPDGTIDSPFGADVDSVTEEMCNGVGGEWLSVTGNMLHVWTVPGYESELGTFNEVNPAITCPDGTYYQIPWEDMGDRTTMCRNP